MRTPTLLSFFALTFILKGCGDDSSAVDGGSATDASAADTTSSTMLCMDTCGPSGSAGEWAGDGECDDGGEGAANAVCALGTDCTDCGSRVISAPGDAGPAKDVGTADAGDDAMVAFDVPVSTDAGPMDSGPACDPEATATFPCGDETCTLQQVCQTDFAGAVELTSSCHDVPFADRCTPCSTQVTHGDCSPRDSRLVFDVSGSSVEGCSFSCRL